MNWDTATEVSLKHREVSWGQIEVSLAPHTICLPGHQEHSEQHLLQSYLVKQFAVYQAFTLNYEVSSFIFTRFACKCANNINIH